MPLPCLLRIPTVSQLFTNSEVGAGLALPLHSKPLVPWLQAGLESLEKIIFSIVSVPWEGWDPSVMFGGKNIFLQSIYKAVAVGMGSSKGVVKIVHQGAN